jgi:alkanesulfonate monooxygenase SsuD/methylene tetrahydromethanopterin reductase-like flavin-dependent oxidoreductase (luciferase family)
MCFAAETDKERAANSVPSAGLYQPSRGTPGPVPAPIDDIREYAADFEIAQIVEALAYSAVGSAETVERQLRHILAQIKPDELMVTGHFHDHAARLRSFEIAAAVRERL